MRDLGSGTGSIGLLHDALRDWHDAALTTNAAALRWRLGLPQSAKSAPQMLEDPMISNIAGGRLVAGTMREELDIGSHRRWDWLRGRAGQPKERIVTLRTLLRAHGGHIAVDVDAVLHKRGELLRSLPEDLQRRYAQGGLSRVDELISELDKTANALANACEELGTFISKRFPLAAA